MQQSVPIGQIVEMLVTGAVLGAVFVGLVFALTRYTRETVERYLLVIFLFTAAGLYVLFAIRAGAGPVWLVAELVQGGIFGAMGLLGLRGSRWWLVAGWALHSLWDIVLYFLGPKIICSYKLDDRMYHLICWLLSLSSSPTDCSGVADQPSKDNSP